MKLFSRLICYCVFAAAGAGAAVYVGSQTLSPYHADRGSATSANAKAKTAAKTRPTPTAWATDAIGQQRAEPAPRPSAEDLRLPTALPSTTALATPHAAAIVPSPRYGQNLATPTAIVSRGEVIGKIADSPQKPQAAPPKAASHSAWNSPTSVKPPASLSVATSKATQAVQNDGEGKLRIHVYNEDIREVLGLLGEQAKLNILVGRNVEGKVSATLSGVDATGAIDAILKSTGYVCRREGQFLFVGTPGDFAADEAIRDPIVAKTYRTNYIRAAELAALIKPLLSRDGVASVSTQADSGILASDFNAGSDRFAGNEVIVVRDRRSTITEIDRIAAEIDVPPLQVAIDAMILRVQLAADNSCGVDFERICRCHPTAEGDGATADASTAGLKIGLLDADPRALLEKLQRDGRTTVVANPRLMVLNKQRAEIHIGRRDGYVDRKATESTKGQNVAFLDTGASLRIRPFISTDGQIRMEIQPEVSEGGVNVQGGFALPSEDITQATTNIMARDGRTVAIGGLIRQQSYSVTTPSPVVGDLPIVGGLFRRTSQQTMRYETLVLITPHIVHETADVRSPGERQ